RPPPNEPAPARRNEPSGPLGILGGERGVAPARLPPRTDPTPAMRNEASGAPGVLDKRTGQDPPTRRPPRTNRIPVSMPCAMKPAPSLRGGAGGGLPERTDRGGPPERTQSSAGSNDQRFDGTPGILSRACGLEPRRGRLTKRTQAKFRHPRFAERLVA